MRDYLQTAKEFVYEEDAVGVVEIILILVGSALSLFLKSS